MKEEYPCQQNAVYVININIFYFSCKENWEMKTRKFLPCIQRSKDKENHYQNTKRLIVVYDLILSGVLVFVSNTLEDAWELPGHYSISVGVDVNTVVASTACVAEDYPLLRFPRAHLIAPCHQRRTCNITITVHKHKASAHAATRHRGQTVCTCNHTELPWKQLLELSAHMDLCSHDQLSPWKEAALALVSEGILG